MAETFRIEGLAELKAKLEAVGRETRNKTGFTALRKAAKDVVAKAAIENARRIDDPATGESIPDAITIKRDNKGYKASGRLKVSVGVRVTGKNPVFYWRFFEFGTEKMAAQPFMRPALAENVPQVTSEFIRQYRRGIDRALKRAARAK